MRSKPWWLIAVAISACGGTQAPASNERIGMSGPPLHGEPPPPNDAIELALRRTDGTFVDVGDLRGHVVVLFVFATFDTFSQMALRPVSTLLERFDDIRVVGIAAQPNARLLIDAYEHALSPPFPITYDPQEGVATGGSALGEIQIPTCVVVDARGVESGRIVGVPDEDALADLVQAAGAVSLATQ